MNEGVKHTGRCLCGDIRYVAEGEPSRVVHCHCSMCRRQSGAAFLTFARFPRPAVRFPFGEPILYRSSPRVDRGFCSRCGSSLTFAYVWEPEVLWVTAGSLDEPERLKPTRNFMEHQRLRWLEYPSPSPRIASLSSVGSPDSSGT